MALTKYINKSFSKIDWKEDFCILDPTCLLQSNWKWEMNSRGEGYEPILERSLGRQLMNQRSCAAKQTKNHTNIGFGAT